MIFLSAAAIGSTETWISSTSLRFVWSSRLVSYVVVPIVADILFYWEIGSPIPGVSPVEFAFVGVAILLVLAVVSERFLLPFVPPVRVRVSRDGVDFQLIRFSAWPTRIHVPWSEFLDTPRGGRPGTVVVTFRNLAQHRQQIALLSVEQYRARLSNPASPPTWIQL